MRHKYKKFLKAAYINYDEDYCGYGSGIFTKPVVTTPIIVIMGTTAIIACAVSGATIYYTLDGSTPTTSSTQYTSAIALTQSCTIKAIAVKSGMTNSGVAEESYVKPITYLTQWKIVGNSEVHGNEIWSCGEYSATDGKYHILVQPLGGSIADIALTEPLRKVNDVADIIEFPSETDGKALVTRPLKIVDWSDVRVVKGSSPVTYFVLYDSGVKIATNNILSAVYPTYMYNNSPTNFGGLGVASHGTGAIIRIVNESMNDLTAEQFKAANVDVEVIYELDTPTTEFVNAPQIAEAESYSCVISQGGKAVSWSGFETE